ncbi:prepilin peptidase [Sphingomonas sp. JC676]|uniref:prepilin peptidase n=1 Tax=Sphingomonas sp. JC676 TaxID=2768065 RepID=UPI0016583C94|nr:prepilin peptidase [Sphingomonas sp. JC676]
MGAFGATFLLGTLVLLLVSAGVQDARFREIANWKNIAIALLAPLWWWANGLALWPDMAIQLGVAAIVFAFFAGAFAIGQMGGGDVKLIGALALWLPLQPLVSMMMTMALIGGGLTLLMVADQWVRRGHGMPKPKKGALAVLLVLGIGIVLLFQPGVLDWLRGQPMLWLLTIMALLCGVSLLLLLALGSARRRGILPEVPYGVAIAIAGLLVLREPILNQFG